MLPRDEIIAITLLAVLVAVILSRVVTGVLSGGLIAIRRGVVVRRQMRAMRRAVCDGKLGDTVDKRAVEFAQDGELDAPLLTTALSSTHIAALSKLYGATASELRQCRSEAAPGGKVALVCDGSTRKVGAVRRCDPRLGFQCRTSYAGYDIPRVRCVYRPKLEFM